MEREDKEVTFWDWDTSKRVTGILISYVELANEVLVSLIPSTKRVRTITVWRREETPDE